MAITQAQNAQNADIVLALAVEGVGLVAAVMIAGISDDIGTAVLVFMIGLWLVWLFMHGSDLQAIANLQNRVQKAVNG